METLAYFITSLCNSIEWAHEWLEKNGNVILNSLIWKDVYDTIKKKQIYPIAIVQLVYI